MNIKTNQSANLKMLEFIAEKLGSLCDKLVFLGGCATALLITDNYVSDTRYTIDVDCIIDVLSIRDYKAVEKELRKKGFQQSIEDTIICRWRIGDAIFDIMPTDEKILGFSNRWYKSAITHAVKFVLNNGREIKLVASPYFLATKFEAFKGRGKNDFFASHDLEDIIYVLDSRPEVITEINNSDIEIKNYVAESFKNLMQNRTFQDALPGHLNYNSLIYHERLSIVRDRILKIINLETIK